MQSMFNSAKDAGQGKLVIITETGWPSEGGSLKGAVATNENAMYFTGRSNSYAGMDLSSSVLSVNGAISFAFWAKETGQGTFSPRVFEFYQGDFGPGFYWFNW
jgi:exo-beta-1,3-glucanase (GH17 family)